MARSAFPLSREVARVQQRLIALTRTITLFVTQPIRVPLLAALAQLLRGRAITAAATTTTITTSPLMS
jgi:hypothetical protein